MEEEGCKKCGKKTNLEKYCPLHGRGCSGCGFDYDIILCGDCDIEKCKECGSRFRYSCIRHGIYGCFPGCGEKTTSASCYKCDKCGF